MCADFTCACACNAAQARVHLFGYEKKRPGNSRFQAFRDEYVLPVSAEIRLDVGQDFDHAVI